MTEEDIANYLQLIVGVLRRLRAVRRVSDHSSKNIIHFNTFFPYLLAWGFNIKSLLHFKNIHLAKNLSSDCMPEYHQAKSIFGYQRVWPFFGNLRVPCHLPGNKL